MAEITNLTSLEARLNRRYPGIDCRAQRIENEYYVEGAWILEFFAKDRETLIRAGLATAEQFDLVERWAYAAKVDRHPANQCEYGDLVSVYLAIGKGGAFHTHRVTSDCPDDRKYTKKLQAQVARMLKPFIKGTWKPSVAAPAVRS